jgi:hypothetical protein
MSIRFQSVLPSIEVEILTHYDITKIHEDIKIDPTSYFSLAKKNIQGLTLNKHGLWESEEVYDDRNVINGRHYVLRAGDVLVTSENGFKYFGPDAGISDGVFTDIPIQLFHPVSKSIED